MLPSAWISEVSIHIYVKKIAFPVILILVRLVLDRLSIVRNKERKNVHKQLIETFMQVVTNSVP